MASWIIGCPSCGLPEASITTTARDKPEMTELRRGKSRARATDPAHEDAGPDPDPTVPFVCATVDGQGLLRGRLGLVLGADGKPDGYVISFGEATQELAALTKRDALLLAADQSLRRPMANLRAAVETLANFPDMAPAERAGFERVIGDESATLSVSGLGQNNFTVLGAGNGIPDASFARADHLVTSTIINTGPTGTGALGPSV